MPDTFDESLAQRQESGLLSDWLLTTSEILIDCCP